MTITYQKQVANSSFLGFVKLLGKWRGSVYKLLCKELLVYATAYASISIIYRNFMSEEQKRVFEKVAIYCHKTVELIPLSFVLGFYVSFVVTRWWTQVITLPWPDRLMHCVTLYISGRDDRGRIIRRTLMRYTNLATIILFQSISGAVKKRFPTLKHLVEAGFMSEEEKDMLENVHTNVNKHWVPLIWFLNLLNVAVKEGRVQQGAPVKHILEELNEIRSKTSLLWGHDWVTVPLVYTQLVTLTTHLFFLTCLLGRQYLDPTQDYHGHELDLYFPFFTFLQFIFFMGWLKVGEQLINPFGEDDDDIETNWVIDRNIQVSYLGVDEMHGKLPRIEKDMYWNNQEPNFPYTEAAMIHKIPSYRGSTMDIVVAPKNQAMVFPDTLQYDNDQNREGLVQQLITKCCSPLPCFPAPEPTPLKDVKVNLLNDVYDSQKATTLGSKTSLFEHTYLHMLNRGLRKSSIASRGSVDYTYSSIPDHSNYSQTSAPNIAFGKRQRASLPERCTLSKLLEEEHENLGSDGESTTSEHTPTTTESRLEKDTHDDRQTTE